MSKPRVTVNPVANQYAADGERIIEYHDRATGLGGLIALRSANGTLTIDLYRHDEGVTIRVPEPEDAYRAAGLGVMRAVMEVVADRERVPAKLLASLDADDVTRLYEAYVGPAADRIEDDLLAPYPTDDAAAEAWA